MSIIALKHGFDAIDKLIPGGIGGGLVGSHTLYLAKLVYDQLLQLHHANGMPVARLYSHTDYKCLSTQGAIVNFNLLRSNGEVIGFMEVSHFEISHLEVQQTCNPLKRISSQVNFQDTHYHSSHTFALYSNWNQYFLYPF